MLQEVCGLYRTMHDTSFDDMKTCIRTGVYKSRMPTNSAEFGACAFVFCICFCVTELLSCAGLKAEFLKKQDSDDIKLRVQVRDIKKANLQHLMALKRNLVATEILFDLYTERPKLLAAGLEAKTKESNEPRSISGLQVPNFVTSFDAQFVCLISWIRCCLF
jgi:hypothetical protein